jgi:hypothetical protein
VLRNHLSRVTALLATTLVATSSLRASPAVDATDPRYEQVGRLIALSNLPASVGGFYPLTEHRMDTLLGNAGAERQGWWVAPVNRFTLRTSLSNVSRRDYRTTLRPRDLAGTISLDCERMEARPCGEGAGATTDAEASAGYAWWLSATARVEATLGSESYAADIDLTRAYVTAESDLAFLELGRDAFALGPASRTALGWSSNAAPLDHARFSTARPWRMSSFASVSGQYIVGRLRAPQTYPGNLVSIIHGQVDLADAVSVGALQMLQLGGEGAADIGVVDFVLEHVRRRDSTASATDSSNRRFGIDIAARLQSLNGLRLYYALVFEDIRRARLIDAFRYDADHLFGAELAALGPDGLHAVTVEWHQTGVRSQEHNPRTTGFTNGNFAVGAPLGPDAESFYVGGRLGLGRITIFPWVELARLSSDTYEIVPYGPINRIANGEDEVRYRIGSRLRVSVQPNLWVDTEVMFERVDDLAFESGATRNGGSVATSIVWHPRGPLGTLELN